MQKNLDFKNQTKQLIDELKSVCANSGLANDGNEYKIITQIFLYKFLNDKFVYEIKLLDKNLSKSKNFSKDLKKYDKNKFEMLLMQLNPNTAKLKPEQLISSIYEKQNDPNFANIFDENLIKIAKQNVSTFSVLTSSGQKITLFENISKYIADQKDEFCKAIINKIINFSFENVFKEKFDFFADIFEYLIKDYNSNSGETYAEYFTPHAVSKIMAACLVDSNVKNKKCYDPSAGSGSLLMNLSHSIGEDKCTIYSQDISQKSSQLLRLNLILNNLVHSIPNIVQGNTIKDPYHVTENNIYEKFDYIVSNPPFKIDFSDYRNFLNSQENSERFFAGIPNIPKKDKKKMPIYLLFLQHIIHSLADKGKSSIVVPTGFLTANGIAAKIRGHLIQNNMLAGVISMPSNIFATTGTNVSVIFIDKKRSQKNVILIDASNFGKKIKEGKNQKTVLSNDDENKIIETFKNQKEIKKVSKLVSNNDIERKKFSFNAAQYFDIKIEYTKMSQDQFKDEINSFKQNIKKSVKESQIMEKMLIKELNKLKYE